MAIDPKSANAHDRLGRVIFHADKSKDHEVGAPLAYDQFKQAVTADKNSISANIAMAQLYQEAKMNNEAQRFITLAVNNPPADEASKLATMIAAAHWALENDHPDQAKDYSMKALAADPTSLEAKFLRGVSARLLKDPETAEKYLEEVYIASPMNFSASNQYAQVLAEQNNKDKRKKALEIARINDKVFGGKTRQGIETAATLGWVLYQMGDLNEADQVMQAIVRTRSPSADALYYRARILQDRGQSEEALKYVTAACEISKAFVHHTEAEDMKAKLAKAMWERSAQRLGGDDLQSDPARFQHSGPRSQEAGSPGGDGNHPAFDIDNDNKVHTAQPLRAAVAGSREQGAGSRAYGAGRSRYDQPDPDGSTNCQSGVDQSRPLNQPPAIRRGLFIACGYRPALGAPVVAGQRLQGRIKKIMVGRSVVLP